MRAVFPLGILLSVALSAPVSSREQSPSLGEILLAEQHRAMGSGELELLWKGTASPDTLLQRRAIRALGRLERPALAERLFPLLAHSLPGVRAEAAQAVAQAAQGLRGDSARGALIVAALENRALSESEPAVRGMLALSLGRLPYPGSEAIVRAREWLLRLGDGVSGAALADVARGMETLTRLTARRVPLTEPALARLREWAGSMAQDARVRRSALGALLAAQAADRATLTAALESPDPLLRRLALTGIARLGERDAQDRLLRGPLADSSALVRAEALRAWARVAGNAACPRLVEAARDSSAAVALLSLDLLGTTCVGDSLAVAALEAAPAPGASWHSAAHALVSLARIAPQRARAGLVPAASASLWQRRLYAAGAAAVLRDTATLRRLARDRIANVREAALAALHQLSGHADDSLYRAALAAADYQLVLTAANALAGTPQRDAAVAALLRALDRITLERKETSRDPRIALLARLRETGVPSLAPRLEPYLRDFDPRVADSAAALLTSWTGVAQLAAPRRLPPLGLSTAELDALRGKRLRFSLNSGAVFEVELFLDEAPLSVARVAGLAARGYYNGLSFHRMVPNFVIQGGSPGANEYAGAPRFMPDELGSRSHERGSLGISTRGRDTGDAQLFINLVDNPRLDYEYTVWGRVVAGLEAVDGVLEGAVIRRVDLVRAAAVRGQGSPPAEPADTAALLSTVRVLAADSMEGRRAGTPGAERARRYLAGRLKALGLAPLGAGYEHSFPLPNGAGTGVNLLAVIPGTTAAGRYLVLSAHYDHLGVRRGEVYNGADDNASGTAAVLALAELLKRQPLSHSVIIALFDAEESGSLGAKAFLADPPVAKAALALDVNLDMVGHSERGELWAAGASHNPALLPVLTAVAGRAPIRLRLGHDRPGVPGEEDWTRQSDQGPFHAAGIPFVYFGEEDHQDYHRPSDDPETLTPAFFAGAVRTVLLALRALDASVP